MTTIPAQSIHYEDDISFGRKVSLHIDDANVSFELLDYDKVAKYTGKLSKKNKIFGVIPPDLFNEAINALIVDKKYLIKNDDGKNCKLVLKYEFMNKSYDIEVLMNREELDTQTQLLADNKKLLLRINTLESKLNSSFLFRPVPVAELKIDWIDFHKFMLATHTNPFLTKWTELYKTAFSKSNVLNIEEFINSQLNGLIMNPNVNVSNVANVANVATTISSTTSVPTLPTASVFPDLTNIFSNIDASQVFYLQSPEVAELKTCLFLTYMSIKGYRPWIMKNIVRFIKCDTPLLIGVGSHILDIGDFYFSCEKIPQNEIVDWSQVATTMSEYIKSISVGLSKIRVK